MIDDLESKVLRKVRSLQEVSLGDLLAKAVEERMNWLMEPDRSIVRTWTPRAAYELFLLDYLGLDSDCVPVVSEAEDEIVWDSINDPTNDEMMVDARRSGADAPIVLAAVILVSADETRRCVMHTCEYGDDEGISNMLDLARQLRRSGKLLDGESVEVVILEKPLDQFQWRPVPEPAKPRAVSHDD